MPTFSAPTRITNPLFPVSKQASVLLLGQVDGEPFRTEVTLLPETRIIEWQGQRVEVLVSQYVAYLSGRLHEVAYDLYAQDDAGSVWYFGEDVFNFEDGAIVDTHGTWIAGKDGPAAMIMPADPKVGDVYRPRTSPASCSRRSPSRPSARRSTAPSARSRAGSSSPSCTWTARARRRPSPPATASSSPATASDVEALALAVPTDALSEPAPAELVTLEAARGASSTPPGGTGAPLGAAVERADAPPGRPSAPATCRTGSSRAERRGAGGDRRGRARDGPRPGRRRSTSARSSLDLLLRHRPVTEIDRARFDLWVAQSRSTLRRATTPR